MTIEEWLKMAKQKIDALDAELILVFAMRQVLAQEVDRSYIFAHAEFAMPMDMEAQLDELLKRRQKGEPLAYILGEKWFYGRKFVVNSDVLIPRPETEAMIELVKTLKLPQKPHFLDVGTGSGCIAITLALEYPQSMVLATDISTRALDMAYENDIIHEGRIALGQSNLLRDLKFEEDEKHFDVVMANLPYVNRDWEWVDEQDLVYEPSRAIYARGNNGLSLYQRLFKQINYRQNLGDLWIDYFVAEADPCQHEALKQMAEKAGLRFLRQDGYALLFEDSWRYWWDESEAKFVRKPEEVLAWELEHGVVHWLPEQVEQKKHQGEW